MTHSPWWSWEAREDTWRQSSPGWTFSCAASTTPASCQQGQSWAPQFRQIGCQCQGWVAWRKRGQPTEGRGQGWGQLQDRQGKPIRVHSSRRPQPPHLSSVPCSPGWRRWRWPKRSLWRCWWCRRPGRPCGSCGGTCCSFPGREELRCRLHKSRRSECLRLGSEHYCCGCYRRTSLQLLIKTRKSSFQPPSAAKKRKLRARKMDWDGWRTYRSKPATPTVAPTEEWTGTSVRC